MPAVELEGARLDRECPRRRPRLGRLVDDPDPRAELGQDDREDEAGRPGADDQHVDGVIDHPSYNLPTDERTQAGAESPSFVRPQLLL